MSCAIRRGLTPTPGTPSCCTITSPPRAGSRWRAGGIAYNSLPNSVSKSKTLARLEQKLADHFAGQAAGLKGADSTNWGRDGGAEGGEDADVQAAFMPLPKVPLLLSFWDAEAEEGFAPQAHLAVRRQRPPLPGPGSHALPGGTPDGAADGELSPLRIGGQGLWAFL